MVIAYEMVKRGFDRGRAEGYAEGRAEGLSEGRAEAYAEIAAYFKRMQEARERGEEFDEPPPGFGDEQEQG